MKEKVQIHYPQDEMRTSLLPATVSCKYNRCSFCSMYKGETYREVALDEIERQLLNMDPYEERIFLTGGDPLSLGFEKMEKLLEKINDYLPYCACVASYASVRSLMTYSVEELSILHNKGLRLLYIGFESGSEKFLRQMNKGHSLEMAIEVGQKLNKANLLFNSIVLIGMGGAGTAKESALATANLLNSFQSRSVITMNLLVFSGTELETMVNEGKFKEASFLERIEEMRLLVEKLEPEKNTIFDSSHPSNIFKTKGVIPWDREKIIRKLTKR